MTSEDLAKKNRRLALVVFGVVAGMVVLAYASVPLYNMFCRVTGFGGTTQVAETAPDKVLDRTVTVKFSASTARDMPWDFKPEQREVVARLGARTMISYLSHNPTDRPITGAAIYNVVPPKAGQYFHKIECFCFSDYTLGPGQTAHMPVVFYVDPALDDDPDMQDLNTITLSYTFFVSNSSALDLAVEDFYNQGAEDSTGLAGKSTN